MKKTSDVIFVVGSVGVIVLCKIFDIGSLIILPTICLRVFERIMVTCCSSSSNSPNYWAQHYFLFLFKLLPPFFGESVGGQDLAQIWVRIFLGLLRNWTGGGEKGEKKGKTPPTLLKIVFVRSRIPFLALACPVLGILNCSQAAAKKN